MNVNLRLADGRVLVCRFDGARGLLGWCDQWELTPTALAEGLLSAVHGGPGTYSHTDYQLGEDVFLRCARCGWFLPITNTDAEERCSECGGEYVISTDERPATLPEQAMRRCAHGWSGPWNGRPCGCGRPEHTLTDCPRCGQLMIDRGTVCDACRELDRAPQGEALTMFDMAPQLAAPQEEGLF